MTRANHSQRHSRYLAMAQRARDAAGRDVSARMPAYQNLVMHFEGDDDPAEKAYGAVDELHRRDQQWQRFLKSRGVRYADCEFSSFESPLPAQKRALSLLADYAAAMNEQSGNVVIFGPVGTGKDHLATALSRIAIMLHDLPVSWTNGPSMYSQFREPINNREVSDDEVILRFTRPTILLISDPVVAGGTLTQHQTDMIYQVIDTRYNERKPTWITVNVGQRSELIDSMGHAIVDRCIDGALSIACDWPSYRKPLTIDTA